MANNVYKRNAVLNAMVQKLREVEIGISFTMKHRFITRDPMGVENIGKLKPGESGVGIYDIDEEKTRNFGYTDATMTVVVEFYYMPKLGQTKSELLNVLLAEVIKALVTDQSLFNTSIKITDVSNNLDIDGIYDKIINGSITFHVTYRHALFDPTSNTINK